MQILNVHKLPGTLSPSICEGRGTQVIQIETEDACFSIETPPSPRVGAR